MEKPLNKIGRIEALDSVRGIAAFIVVIHHCFLTRAVYSNFFFSNWKTPATDLVSWIFLYTPARIAWSGYEAVTLFYVLSGLVLALPWVEGRAPDYKKFAIRRMCRLYIPYAAIVIVAGAINIALQQHAYVSGASDWVNTMTWTNSVTPFVLFDHFAIIGHHFTINGVTHTLIWEIRVLLIFPLLIVPIRRWGARGAMAVLACLTAIVVGTQLVYGNISLLGDLLVSVGARVSRTRGPLSCSYMLTTPVFSSLEPSSLPISVRSAPSSRAQGPGWASCFWAAA